MHPRESASWRRPSALPWPPLLLAGAVAGSWILGFAAPLAWPGNDDLPAHIVGLGFGAMGLALLAWAVATLNRHDTTVLPHEAARSLVTSGPYRYRRNPIYLADVMILLGIAELTKNIWFALFALAFAIAVTWLAILPEERHLEARFGDAYRDYKARTRRWI